MGYGRVVEELWNNVENVNVVIYFFLSYLVIRKCTYDETNERIAKKKSISSYTQTYFILFCIFLVRKCMLSRRKTKNEILSDTILT